MYMYLSVNLADDELLNPTAQCSKVRKYAQKINIIPSTGSTKPRKRFSGT